MGFKINMDNMDLIYFVNFYDKKNYKKLIRCNPTFYWFLLYF